jgi:asparagine synthase (glutamine-hydrolysing)
MCGITGFLSKNNDQSTAELTSSVTRMSDTLRHRGPDDSGSWVDEYSGVALGFRRLAILDLSPAGHQPMVSFDGRFVIVFNGEIYNFLEIRLVLEEMGATFVGTSDTEVILASVCQWGVVESVRRFNGMFAFVIWDRLEKCLWLARDRIGIKPLYYGWMGKVLLFGSELKALAANPNFKAVINRDALVSYLRFGYIPTPLSIYENVHKLESGTILRIQSLKAPENQEKICYWSAREVVMASLNSPFLGDEQEAITEFDRLISRSVRERMIADVPLGAFLSGGVDSSTIVSMMQQQTTQRVKTFTIGFGEKDYNEAAYASAVARHLHTDHTELYANENETRDVIPHLPTLYDEPFADSSQIPTFLVAELARKSVTVSLSGDGGDELFAGYDRYFWARNIRKNISWLSQPNKQRLAQTIQGLIKNGCLLNSIARVMPSRFHQPYLSGKMKTISEVIDMESPKNLYKSLAFHHCDYPELLVLGGTEPETILTDQSKWPSKLGITEMLMYLDLMTYLPDDILAKVDRASMGVNLEVRVPFLDDHRIVEFAWQLPLSMKIKGNQGKQILRQVLYQYVPKNLIERPKMGFLIPINSWLRGSLRDWAEGLLEESKLGNQGFLNPVLIRQKWKNYQTMNDDELGYLWDVLMFQAWLEEIRL